MNEHARCVINAGPLRGVTGRIIGNRSDGRLMVQFDEPKGVVVVIAAELVNLIEPESDYGKKTFVCTPRDEPTVLLAASQE
jgi:hypothetical protein